MSRKAHILNLSTGLRVDHLLASGAIEACSAVWVERGVSIRNVTEHEAIALRNHRAAVIDRDHVSSHEVAGCVYEPSLQNAASHKRERSYAMLTRRVMGARQHVPLTFLCQRRAC